MTVQQKLAPLYEIGLLERIVNTPPSSLDSPIAIAYIKGELRLWWIFMQDSQIPNDPTTSSSSSIDTIEELNLSLCPIP